MLNKILLDDGAGGYGRFSVRIYPCVAVCAQLVSRRGVIRDKKGLASGLMFPTAMLKIFPAATGTWIVPAHLLNLASYRFFPHRIKLFLRKR